MDRKISVIGLGYIGLPLAIAFGKKYDVIAFDIKTERVAELLQKQDSTHEISAEQFENSRIRFTASPADLEAADFHIIAVPTPITRAKHPDLRALLNASSTVGSILKHGDIVVYESTVYPGATEEECVPVLERESGLKAGQDFHVAYSPERINPGDKNRSFETITKIVSAQTVEVLEEVANIYGSVITAEIYKAPSIRVAEAAKVVENTQRDVNIALMNEFALIFDNMNIDTGDVLDAASTKWNFLNFRPGLVGGHCIGVDPYYLTYRSTLEGYIPDIINASRNINDGMGASVAARVIKGIIHCGYNVKGANVIILGLTFKENVSDIRNSRVIDIIKELQKFDINIQVHDPFASKPEAAAMYGIELIEQEGLKPADAVILAVAHDDYKDNGWGLVTGLLQNGAGYVFDVQRILDREQVTPGITLERL